MKKADLEAHRDQYKSLFDQAKQAEAGGRYHRTIELALDACAFIDGMMRFETKYSEKEFASVGAIDLVLKYAPFYFDLESLDRLESLLDEYRRIERDTSHDMGAKLTAARHQTWENYRLWNHIEAEGSVRQSELRGAFGGDQTDWRDVVEQWVSMGVLSRVSEGGSYRVTITTRMESPADGKCPGCAAVVNASKSELIGRFRCPKCGRLGPAVLLSSEASGSVGA